MYLLSSKTLPLMMTEKEKIRIIRRTQPEDEFALVFVSTGTATTRRRLRTFTSSQAVTTCGSSLLPTPSLSEDTQTLWGPNRTLSHLPRIPQPLRGFLTPSKDSSHLMRPQKSSQILVVLVASHFLAFNNLWQPASSQGWSSSPLPLYPLSTSPTWSTSNFFSKG